MVSWEGSDILNRETRPAFCTKGPARPKSAPIRSGFRVLQHPARPQMSTPYLRDGVGAIQARYIAREARKWTLNAAIPILYDYAKSRRRLILAARLQLFL